MSLVCVPFCTPHTNSPLGVLMCAPRPRLALAPPPPRVRPLWPRPCVPLMCPVLLACYSFAMCRVCLWPGPCSCRPIVVPLLLCPSMRLRLWFAKLTDLAARVFWEMGAVMFWWRRFIFGMITSARLAWSQMWFDFSITMFSNFELRR